MLHSGSRNRLLAATVHGPCWIVVGMAWVGLAQLGSGLPMATAVVVIGTGAMGLVSRRRSPLLCGYFAPGGIVSLLNLLAYVALAGLTIAAQWDLALRSPAGRLGLLMVVDHALAMLLLLHLTWRTAHSLIVESP